MSDPLPDTLQTGPSMTWFIAQVTAVDNVNHSVTVLWRGASVVNVAYLSSYTPVINDVVHGIIWDHNGMLIWGKEVLPPADVPVTPPSPTTPGPIGGATYTLGVDNSWVWQPDVVRQSPVDKGAFFYAAGVFTPLVGVVLATLELQVTLSADSNPLGIVLTANTDTTAPFQPVSLLYLYNVPPGVATWVPLPLSWADLLSSGAAAGIGFTSDMYSATVVAGGTLRFTPL